MSSWKEQKVTVGFIPYAGNSNHVIRAWEVAAAPAMSESSSGSDSGGGDRAFRGPMTLSVLP